MNLHNYTKKNIYPSLYWIILLLIVIIFHQNNPLDADEGVILAGAWDIFNDRKIYVDFFEFIPPGSFYLVAATWKLFGTSYFTANLVSTILLFVSAVGIYKITAQLQRHYLTYAPPLIFTLSSFHWPLINHNFYNISVIIWAIYFFLSGINDLERNPRSNKFLVSGLLTSLGIIFLHNRGFIFCAANILFILILLIKNDVLLIIRKGGIYLLASLAPLLILFLIWPPTLLYSCLISFPLNHYIEVNKIPLTMFFIFMGYLCLTSVIIGGSKDKRIRYLVYIQLIFLLSTITRPDKFHISIILFPLYILLSISKDAKETKINHCLQIRTSFIISLLLISIFTIVTAPSLLYIYRERPIFTDQSTNIVSKIKEFCDDSPYIYAGPFLPGIYFESRKLNPSEYSYIITNMYPEQVFTSVKKSLVKYQPSCAILNYKIVDKFNYNKDNVVDNFIHENFTEIVKRHNYSIYRKSNKSERLVDPEQPATH